MAKGLGMQPDLAPTVQMGAIRVEPGERWRKAVMLLGLCVIALAVVTAREWSEMFHQWWDIDTYNHILLVPAVICWLVWLKGPQLGKAEPLVFLPGLGVVAGALALWLVGRVTGINLLAHAGAVGAMQGAVIAVLGLRVSLLLALPIGFAGFLVPFGDELIPALQFITAKIAVALTLWSGIPASVDGIYIDTPVGLFIVAEACSGVKFLIAMVALAVLVAFTRFESWSRRFAFLAISILVPILANGVRAFGTIYVAQINGIEFAEGFDHIVYGWLFFAVIVALLLAGAWRFFEREPDEQGWTYEVVSDWPWVRQAEAATATPSTIAGAIAALIFIAGMLAAIVEPVPVG